MLVEFTCDINIDDVDYTVTLRYEYYRSKESHGFNDGRYEIFEECYFDSIADVEPKFSGTDAELRFECEAQHDLFKLASEAYDKEQEARNEP